MAYVCFRPVLGPVAQHQGSCNRELALNCARQLSPALCQSLMTPSVTRGEASRYYVAHTHSSKTHFRQKKTAPWAPRPANNTDPPSLTHIRNGAGRRTRSALASMPQVSG